MIGVPWDPTPGAISSEMKTAALVPGEEGGIVDVAPEEAPTARRLRLKKDDFLFFLLHGRLQWLPGTLAQGQGAEPQRGLPPAS